MKRILFNDKYDLTKAVLEGRKTMTRRIVIIDSTNSPFESFSVLPYNEESDRIVVRRLWHGLHNTSFHLKPAYKPGEVVAVAQAYKDAIDPLDWINTLIYKDEPSWTNKMFVGADLMPHQIFINAVRVERLQDISDEDCIREGIEEDHPYYWVPVNMSLPNWRKTMEGVSDMYPNDRDGKVYPHFWDSPRKAFAALIDKVSGKGTWESNPWVFVYEFELVK